MITIPQIVTELIHKSPFLEELLSQGLINHSALARTLKPEIEKKLYREVQLGAIVVALNRLSTKLQPQKSDVEKVLANLGDVTLRSNIVSYTYANSATLRKKQARMLDEISSVPNSFVTATDGVFETAFFVSANVSSHVEQLFQTEHLKNKTEHLSSITIVIPEEALQVPGVYYSILRKLAWEGISFIEVVSSFTELTIFLENKNIERAFTALKN